MVKEGEGNTPLESNLEIVFFKGEFAYCLFCGTVGIECSLFPDHIKYCTGAKPLCEIIPRKNIVYEKIVEFALNISIFDLFIYAYKFIWKLITSYANFLINDPEHIIT